MTNNEIYQEFIKYQEFKEVKLTKDSQIVKNIMVFTNYEKEYQEFYTLLKIELITEDSKIMGQSIQIYFLYI